MAIGKITDASRNSGRIGNSLPSGSSDACVNERRELAILDHAGELMSSVRVGTR